MNPDLIRAVNPEGEDLLAEVDEPPLPMWRMKAFMEAPELFGHRGEWGRGRDDMLDRIDVVRPDLAWALRQKSRDLLALVSDLVLLLPSVDKQGHANIQAEVDALLAQATGLRSRLGGG